MIKPPQAPGRRRGRHRDPLVGRTPPPFQRCSRPGWPCFGTGSASASASSRPPAATGAYLDAHPEERAKDFNAAFADPEVDLVIAAIGGSDAVRLLPYLDLDLIRANPNPCWAIPTPPPT